jgi:hypothetical protein
LRIGRDPTRSGAAQTRSRLAACPSAHVVPASAVVPWGREDATPSGAGSTALRHEPLRLPAGLAIRLAQGLCPNLQDVLRVQLLLRRGFPAEHYPSLTSAEQPAPERRFGGSRGSTSCRLAQKGEAVLGAHGVAAPKDGRVRPPSDAGLRPDLLFYTRQGVPLHATEARGFVFDAEQDEVFVLDPVSL